MKFGIYSRPSDTKPKSEIRAENARAVQKFLDSGGKITRCPSGDSRLSA